MRGCVIVILQGTCWGDILKGVGGWKEVSESFHPRFRLRRLKSLHPNELHELREGRLSQRNQNLGFQGRHSKISISHGFADQSGKWDIR